jgi:cell division protein ZapA
MEELSIKIKIADREYPMKVKRSDEERVRMAGKLINEKLKSYRE